MKSWNVSGTRSNLNILEKVALKLKRIKRKKAMISQSAQFKMKKVKPVFTLKSLSDYHLISHYSITAELNIKVTRMKKMITNQ